MKVSMKVEGGAELARALNALPTRVSKKVMRDALEVAGEPIRKGMEMKAPRAPGAPDMADHMVISTAKVEGLIDNDQTAAVKIGPAKGFYWGLFQEFGTIHHGAQPFARPAFDAGVSKAISEMVRATWTALAGRGISRSISQPSTPSSPGGGGLL